MKTTLQDDLPLPADTVALHPLQATTSTGTSSWWDRLVERIAPLGYEDQRGFHFGEEPGDEGPVSFWIKPG